jgi:serine/threonine protein kinase/DNA-binding response OmpR family regulator
MDVTRATGIITRDQFRRSLAESRLLPESAVEKFVRDHPDIDAIGLAHALIESGQLTAYQADVIGQGRGKELHMGNYDVLDRLGAGGMGTVLKARHRRMKRIVALKVLSPSLSQDESFVQRFQREVETIALLKHPNIVMAYDADECEFGHFLVMEFVDGRDLSSIVAKIGPLDVAHSIDYTLQAARGLAYAHSQKIIHRDIKPANLLLDSTGVVKVTDLGLARLNPAAGGGSTSTGITQSGGVLGTVDYMSPEQAVDSTTIDHRTDVYSLGCTLYFLLVGKAIYAGGNVMAVLVRHREAPIPPLSAAGEEVPQDLERIYRRMVAKRAEDRYQSMDEVVAELETLANRLGAKPPPPVSVVNVPPIKSPSSVAAGRPEERTIVAAPRAASQSTVLVVEPSRMQARIVRGYLETLQYAVAGVVATGAEAIASIRADKPGAIVATLYLDDMTGIELAKQVRNEIKENAPGFVLIASDAEGSDTSLLSQLSRTVLLAKPFTAAQLQQSLNQVTGESQAHISTDFSVAGMETTPRDRGMLKVLIADDSAAARANERAVLKDLGFATFAEVADGAQAIAAVAREEFDLIVTDYNMPLMDGHALVAYLRQTPATASIPIVMVTTETDPKVLDPVRRLGVAGICSKRFLKDEVQAIVERLF